jgi:hypothetical protein
MKQDHRETKSAPDTGKQRLVTKSGETMHDYSRKYVANAAMRNAVDTHAEQNAPDETGKGTLDKSIRPIRYRIVKSFLGIRDRD